MKPLKIRRTKVIATIGPKCDTDEAITDLITAGVNVFRLNLSHGTHEKHAEVVTNIREASKRLGSATAILLDLQGPKIRVGLLKNGPVLLRNGENITITTDECDGTAERVHTDYEGLPTDVAPGATLLIDDGLMELAVEKVSGPDVLCRIISGGLLKDHKGINLPRRTVSAPALTEKDRADIVFAVEQGVDFIALSFVRKGGDVLELKALLEKMNAEIPVISKIETEEAIGKLNEIMAESFGIMVARGDLGVELSAERVPVLQKKMITAANLVGKCVITATQMLESMITNPRPTRAEASDVANAVFDGTDAVMLSGESAVGVNPVNSVETMIRIVDEAETAIEMNKYLRRNINERTTFSEAVVFAAVAAAGEVNSKCIVVFTQTGESARLLSKLRSKTPVIAFTMLEKTRRLLSITWGVEPFTIEFGAHSDEMIASGEAELIKRKLCKKTDPIVLVSGTLVGVGGATNMMMVDWAGGQKP